MTTSDENTVPMRGNEICFGFDRASDERSMAAFIERFARPELLAVLLPRLADGELAATLDFLTNLMHSHLSEKEYHQLFLADKAF